MSLSYEVTNWENGKTVLKAEHLRKIEKGITDIIAENDAIYKDEDIRKSNEKQRQEEHSRKMNEVSEVVSDIQKDYDSLQKIIIDENASANLQNQINQTNSQLEHNANNEYINLNDELNVINLKNIIINDTHKKVQGMCITNNKILCSVIKDDISATKLYIFDKSTYKHEEVKTISCLGHSNSMTFNHLTNEIIVASTDNKLYILDSDNYEVKQTITLNHNCIGVAYDKIKNNYVLDDGNFRYYIYNESFEKISEFKIKDTGLTKQSLEKYNDLIFMLFWDGGEPNSYQSGGDKETQGLNTLYVFNVKGVLLKTYSLGCIGECEDISYIDGDFLINTKVGDDMLSLFAINVLTKYNYNRIDRINKNSCIYGFESAVREEDDIDGYKVAGVFRVNGSGLGDKLLNYPSKYNGKLFVEPLQNTGYILQKVIDRIPTEYTRVYDGTTQEWSEWKEIKYVGDNDTGWIELTLENGYTSAGAGEKGVYCRKVDNKVQFKGNIYKNPLVANQWHNLCVIPEGFRPNQDLYFTTSNKQGTIITINVTIMGNVSIYCSSTIGDYTGLNMINYYVD